MISNVGRYEIIRELGQGAMGVVYKALDPLIDRVVAIKTINLNQALDEREEYEGRFYQEARAAGRLSHQNIVTIYDVGKSEDVAYIAMEFLQGRELRDLLNEQSILPINRVLDITIQVARGLAYAHEHGIVHRDVKPSNIMVMNDGHVKITDFGIARMSSAAVRTQTGMVLGSPKYMSPEQVIGKAIDQRSDIFSLGVMLYEMLTGSAPFAGENINAIMYQTLNASPPSPGSLNAAVPDVLNFICAKALAKKLEDRYQTAAELAEDLRACRDSLSRERLPSIIPAAAGADAAETTQPLAPVSGLPEDTEGAASALRLSGAFDSMAATLRLATMTNDAQEVEGLAQTLKQAAHDRTILQPAIGGIPIGRPDIEAAAQQETAASKNEGSGNLILAAVIVLVLASVVLVLVFWA
jgi:serine/threonine-protein kinase